MRPNGLGILPAGGHAHGRWADLEFRGLKGPAILLQRGEW